MTKTLILALRWNAGHSLETGQSLQTMIEIGAGSLIRFPRNSLQSRRDYLWRTWREQTEARSVVASDENRQHSRDGISNVILSLAHYDDSYLIAN